MNGSSPSGGCATAVTSPQGVINCTQPRTSVLFDGDIPTLTGLDGDEWASQLLTLQPAVAGNPTVDVTFDFTATQAFTLVRRVEVVMFNCPQWGIAIQGIQFFHLNSIGTSILSDPKLTSCDSLVRMCVQYFTDEPVLHLKFFLQQPGMWTHLAEVTFYNSGTCPPDAIIDETPSSSTPIVDTVEMTPESESTFLNATTLDVDTVDTTTPANTLEDTMCTCTFPSCSTPVVLASSITCTVIVTALLATLINVLIVIAVCKCHPKFTPGGAETGTSAGGEGQVYEQVDGGEGGVAMSDPTYMEVGAGGGGEGGGGTETGTSAGGEEGQDYVQMNRVVISGSKLRQVHEQINTCEGGVAEADPTYVEIPVREK